MYILLAIALFCLLIIVHEFGHFLAAKLFGVRVNEFSLFMGPKLLQFRGGETVYSLRLLPIGGFCAMEGEDEESDDPRAFTSAKPWKRAVILFAGPLMNLLAGLLIVLLLYLPAKGFSSPVIDRFFEGCPYESADGLQPGDRFYKIDGRRVYLLSDISFLLSRNPEQRYELTLLRGGEKVTLHDYPLVPTEYVIDGKPVLKYGFYTRVEPASPGALLRAVGNTGLHFSRLVWLSLGDLVRGTVGVRDLSGVIGIVSTMNESGASAETAEEGVSNVLYIAAFIAVNLAVMNLLPLPALDGGQIFFLLISAAALLLTKKPIPQKYARYVNTAGLMLLMLLMLVIAFQDVLRLVT